MYAIVVHENKWCDNLGEKVSQVRQINAWGIKQKYWQVISNIWPFSLAKRGFLVISEFTCQIDCNAHRHNSAIRSRKINIVCVGFSKILLFSHSRGGKELHNLPVSCNKERSLIVIQGLTLYNKVSCFNDHPSLLVKS